MQIKTNVRAGQGGSNSVDSSATTSTDTSSQNQKGKTTNTVVYYVAPVSRCVGI
jgi:hypothetical protein